MIINSEIESRSNIIFFIKKNRTQKITKNLTTIILNLDLIQDFVYILNLPKI